MTEIVEPLVAVRLVDDSIVIQLLRLGAIIFTYDNTEWLRAVDVQEPDKEHQLYDHLEILQKFTRHSELESVPLFLLALYVPLFLFGVLVEEANITLKDNKENLYEESDDHL